MGVMNMLQDNGFYSVALVGEDKNGEAVTPWLIHHLQTPLHGSHNPFDDPAAEAADAGFTIAIVVVAGRPRRAGRLPVEEQVRAEVQGVLGRRDGRELDQAGAAAAAAASAASAAEHAAAAAAQAAAPAAGRRCRTCRRSRRCRFRRSRSGSRSPEPPAAPPPEPPRPSVITSPTGCASRRRGPGPLLSRTARQRMEVEGRATISCTVNASGHAGRLFDHLGRARRSGLRRRRHEDEQALQDAADDQGRRARRRRNGAYPAPLRAAEGLTDFRLTRTRPRRRKPPGLFFVASRPRAGPLAALDRGGGCD